MKTYLAVVHKDRDSAFGVSFPDLPGCFGAGDTRFEAVESAKISLREYAQSLEEMEQPLPEARTIDDIMNDPLQKETIEGGEFFIEVPLISVGTRTRVNISIDKNVLDAIDNASALAKVNRSAFITEVASEWLSRKTGLVSTATKKLPEQSPEQPLKPRKTG